MVSMHAGAESMADQIAEIYHSESRRVLATLIRLLGDFDLAHPCAAWRPGAIFTIVLS